MTRPSICPPRLGSEYDFPGHSLMRHFAVERWKPLKIFACPSPRLRTQRIVESADAVELHLREQHGFPSPYRKRICPCGRAMQDQRTDVRELLQNLRVLRLVIGLESRRIGRSSAIPHEI